MLVQQNCRVLKKNVSLHVFKKIKQTHNICFIILATIDKSRVLFMNFFSAKNYLCQNMFHVCQIRNKMSSPEKNFIYDLWCVVTLQKWEVYAQLNALAKCFKICHIFGTRKHSTIFFSLKWKMKKNYLGFLIPKIWQILKHFARQFHQA